MAGYDEYLSDAVGALSVNDDHWKEFGLDNNIRIQLNKIENDYDSIFSWGIQRLAVINENLMMNFIDKIRGKQESVVDMESKDNEFNLNKFYLQLVASYELYNSKNYKESYLEIESVVKFMETCKFDKSNEQYSDAYHHIARATNAYVALTLNIDSEKLLKNIKQINNFNEAEKSAIYAVKARIFMEYPPKGNIIGLEFADQACKLHSTEPEWINIWLKAKGRVRRYYKPFGSPGDDEIDAAKILCSTKNSKFLIEASHLYQEAGFANKLNNNYEESINFFKLSTDIAHKISIELVEDDISQLYSLLRICIQYPTEFLSKSIIDNVIAKLLNVRNNCVDNFLGRYYFKYEKDYVKAKMYFSRGVAVGYFNSSLWLIRLECQLKPVNQFPFVKTLNMMYDVFQSPNNRIVILSHILMYYNYCENNTKEMMWYLKLYLDEDIADIYKKRILIFVRPLFNEKKTIRPNEFLNILSVNVNELMNNNEWGEEEKKVNENTFYRFNKILQLNIQDNHFDDNAKTNVHKKNESWRHQRIELSKNKSNESLQQKNLSWRKQRDPKHEIGSHPYDGLNKKDNTRSYSK